jgi:hypothetical protein
MSKRQVTDYPRDVLHVPNDIVIFIPKGKTAFNSES